MRRLVLTGYVAHRPGLSGNHESVRSVSHEHRVVKVNANTKACEIVPVDPCRRQRVSMDLQKSRLLSMGTSNFATSYKD
jgi:hypothetical protein